MAETTIRPTDSLNSADPLNGWSSDFLARALSRSLGANRSGRVSALEETLRDKAELRKTQGEALAVDLDKSIAGFSPYEN